MTLINSRPWPPTGWTEVFDLYKEHAAWFSGDPITLSSVYAGRLAHSKFWSKQLIAERRVMLHVPVAGDISATSASMLFSEHPVVKIPGADASGSPEEKTQQHLNELIEATSFFNLLSEAAESASALGGVFIKVNWDKKRSSYPIPSIVQADCAIPHFWFGILTSVDLYRVIETDDDDVTWWHCEEHTAGKIINHLFRGTEHDHGSEVDLSSRPETADLPAEIDTGLPGLACRYIPNMRPNRRFRNRSIGQSDYSGIEGVMDSIDEVWTSWMRDIRLGVGRLVGSQSMFEKDSETGEYSFDLDREAYIALNAPLGEGNLKDQIDQVQFDIRAEAHKATIDSLLRQAYTLAGYSPQTFGLDIQGQAESGTALKTRERRTFITTAKKAGYWAPAIADILEIMLQIDKRHLDGKVEPLRPNVEMQDSVQSSVADIASSLDLVNRAAAVSLITKIRMLHPDWGPEQVEAEKQAILDEQGANVPDPTTLGRGDSENDEEAE
ncbi:phage capsid protein [bacterium]|nr:phage capsid protein [bacterium]